MTINGKRGTSSRLFPSLCLHRTMVVLGLRKARMAVRIRLDKYMELIYPEFLRFKDRVCGTLDRIICVGMPSGEGSAL